jgi:TRAP-type C4-dicarboxylate transport system substrate-binding protein
MTHRIISGLLGALTAIAMAAPNGASAETTTLKFAMPGAAHDQHYEQVLIPWAKKVEQESKGTVAIQFFVGPRLANFGNMLDRILDGVVDIGFGLLGPTGQPFHRTDVAQLPFISGDPAEVAPALWTLYENGTIAEEYKRWKVLAFFAFPGNQIHATVPLAGMDDLKGRKFAVTAKILSQTLTALGGTPVSMAPPDQYQAISNGVLQGNVMPWTGIDDFKIYEVTKYHLEANLGVSTAYVFMSKASYDKLPPQAKKAIDDNSGLGFSRALGNNTSAHGLASSKKIGALPGQTIKQLSADQQAKWEKVLQPVIDTWTKATPDGPKILAAYTALIKKYKNSK